MTEVNELQNIAVSIIKSAKINVIIDNSLPTAMTDFKTIYVTMNLIPKELRRYKRVVSRILDGQVAHEAGHCVITEPISEKLRTWMERQPNQKLANLCHQGLEDKRTNHYILLRYRFDLAHRLQLLADVSNRLWVDTLKLQLDTRKGQLEQTRNATSASTEEEFVEEKLIPLSFLKGLWNYEVEKDFQMNIEQKDFMRKIHKVFDEARFDKMTMAIQNRHQQLYDILDERIQKGKSSQQPEKSCPRSLGGELDLQSGQETKKALQKLEKAFKEAEEKSEGKAEEEEETEEDVQDNVMAIGTGSGLKIPSPQPNEPEYLRIVQKNREHIERLLNLLKKLAKPKLITNKWRKQGRFMTEILGKAFASSKRRAVQDVYANRTMQLEKAQSCIGLLIDLSGSVREEDAKDTLTVIAEVCGRWLRDEDFAILVFGSNYQKIKAFVEPYHTTRNRIGGITGMGGTELYQPLHEMYQMLKAQHNNRDKILMIVSDFYVSEEEKCRKLIKNIEKDGISVIGLGIDSSNENYIKTFCQKARYIGNITQLPEAVFDLYREAAF